MFRLCLESGPLSFCFGVCCCLWVFGDRAGYQYVWSLCCLWHFNAVLPANRDDFMPMILVVAVLMMAMLSWLTTATRMAGRKKGVYNRPEVSDMLHRGQRGCREYGGAKSGVMHFEGRGLLVRCVGTEEKNRSVSMDRNFLKNIL